MINGIQNAHILYNIHLIRVWWGSFIRQLDSQNNITLLWTRNIVVSIGLDAVLFNLKQCIYSQTP